MKAALQHGARPVWDLSPARIRGWDHLPVRAVPFSEHTGQGPAPWGEWSLGVWLWTGTSLFLFFSRAWPGLSEPVRPHSSAVLSSLMIMTSMDLC